MMKGLKDIYFYNANGLATELKDGSFSQYRAVKHLIASLVLFGIGFEIPVTIKFTESNINAAQLIVQIVLFIIAGVISYYGAWLVYQVNEKGDGKDFFMRFTVLSLPVAIQLIVIFLWVGLLFAVVAIALTSTIGILGAYLTLVGVFVAVPVFLILYFIRLRKYIAIAAGVNEQ
ncbi:MAG TPA: hypothetical protein ENJ87_08640 [Gammaproteobacteria bacterium]|nr:hypothetical protein [Gammaproteobacteria bacterium]